MTDVFASIDDHKVPLPPRELLEIVAQLPPRHEHATEKRTAQRFRLVTLVPAAPLDDDWAPCGEAFTAVSTDISTGGIGLLHTRMLTCTHLALVITPPGGKSMRMIAKVVRSRPFSGMAAIGCEFVKRFESKAEGEQPTPSVENNNAEPEKISSSAAF